MNLGDIILSVIFAILFIFIIIIVSSGVTSRQRLEANCQALCQNNLMLSCSELNHPILNKTIIVATCASDNPDGIILKSRDAK